MRLAFCDDEAFFVNKISAAVNRYFSQRNVLCACDKFVSASKLLLACKTTTYDAVFLDVDMPEQNGIDTAAEIKKLLPQCAFIFVSAHIEYATQGYYVNAIRYVLKSHLEAVLPNCLDALLERMKPQAGEMILLVEGKDVRRKLSDIIYFEGAQHYVAVHYFEQKSANELACAKLNDLEQQLKERGFLRIQKSLLVNLRYVCSIKNYIVTLRNGTQLKVSETNYATIRVKYLLWKGDNI